MLIMFNSCHLLLKNSISPVHSYQVDFWSNNLKFWHGFIISNLKNEFKKFALADSTHLNDKEFQNDQFNTSKAAVQDKKPSVKHPSVHHKKTVSSTQKPSVQHKKFSVKHKYVSSTKIALCFVLNWRFSGFQLTDVLNWRFYM